MQSISCVITSYSILGETQAVFMMCAISAIDPCQRYFLLVTVTIFVFYLKLSSTYLAFFLLGN